jgi:hypothetical protein
MHAVCVDGLMIALQAIQGWAVHVVMALMEDQACHRLMPRAFLRMNFCARRCV